MRGLWLVAALLIPAGCLDDKADAPPTDVQPPSIAATDAKVDEPADAADPQTMTERIAGRYKALKPFGDKLSEEGGVNPLAVSGWSAVTVTLDSSIEVDLVLLPSGCAGTADACAVRFSPPEDKTDGTWMLPSMEPGSWTAVVEADADDYSYVDGVYEIRFEYIAA